MLIVAAPGVGLDDRAHPIRKRIQNLVHHLTARGIGVLITDHNVRETLGLIDRAYIIHAGEVLTHGRANDIVNNPEVRRLYLGDNFSL